MRVIGGKRKARGDEVGRGKGRAILCEMKKQRKKRKGNNIMRRNNKR